METFTRGERTPFGAESRRPTRGLPAARSTAEFVDPGRRRSRDDGMPADPGDDSGVLLAAVPVAGESAGQVLVEPLAGVDPVGGGHSAEGHAERVTSGRCGARDPSDQQWLVGGGAVEDAAGVVRRLRQAFQAVLMCPG